MRARRCVFVTIESAASGEGTQRLGDQNCLQRTHRVVIYRLQTLMLVSLVRAWRDSVGIHQPNALRTLAAAPLPITRLEPDIRPYSGIRKSVSRFLALQPGQQRLSSAISTRTKECGRQERVEGDMHKQICILGPDRIK
jgi:hypothetical protein